MLFLANENFPLTSVRILQKAGYDVLSIRTELPGITDKEVLKLAANERRIILTFDGDYGELLFRYKLPAPRDYPI